MKRGSFLKITVFFAIVSLLALSAWNNLERKGFTGYFSIQSSEPALEQGEKEELLLSAKKTIYAYLNRETAEPVAGIFSGKRVYVTAWKNGYLLGCQPNYLKSQDLGLKASDAALHSIRDSRFYGHGSEYKNMTVEVNVLGEFEEVKARSLEGINDSIELGIHGLKLENGKKQALFLPSVPARHGYGLKTTLEQLCKKAGLNEDCYSGPDAKLYKFETEAFWECNGKFSELMRGNSLVELENVSVESLEESIYLAGKWFLANGKENGLYNYYYIPASDYLYSSDSQIRQFGGLWAAAKIANHTNNKQLRKESIEKAEKFASMLEWDGEMAWFPEGKESRLGTSALFLLALLELNRGEFAGEISGLQEFILSMQLENGSFYTHYPKKIKDSAVDYYPGESLLALMESFEKENCIECLEAVEKAFPFYKAYFGENKKTAFVPWQSSAYSKAFLATEKKEYLEFVVELNDWVLEKQDNNAPWPDYLGGFSKGGIPGASTCSYAEGLGDALIAVSEAGYSEKEKKYYNAMEKAMRFALQLQFNEFNSCHLKKPEKAIGGYRNSLASEKIRVDNVQHCSSAIFKFLEFGKRQK